MKKMIAACAALLLLASLLAGCGSAPAPENAPFPSAQSAAPEALQPQNEPDTEPSNGVASAQETGASSKTLVVYYSATGNTKNVADVIAEATGADTFSLLPVEPYTDADLDWTDKNSRCSLEYANPDMRNVALTAATADNWSDYDTVFVGYPIWWGIAAWPVDAFIKANDFTGKSVIPFCTSSSSGLGHSGNLLAEMAGSGDWQTGIRFRSGVSDADVQAWVSELGR